MNPPDGGDHSGWYAMALSLIAVIGGLLGLRKKASSDSVQIAKDTAEKLRIESAEEELQRLRRELEDCRTEKARLDSDNAHLSGELISAQHYAEKYFESLAKRAGTDFADLRDLPPAPPQKRR